MAKYTAAQPCLILAHNDPRNVYVLQSTSRRSRPSHCRSAFFAYSAGPVCCIPTQKGYFSYIVTFLVPAVVFNTHGMSRDPELFPDPEVSFGQA